MAELAERTRQALTQMGLPRVLIDGADDDSFLPDAPERPCQLNSVGIALLRNHGIPEAIIERVCEDVLTGSVSGIEPLALRTARLEEAAQDDRRGNARERQQRRRLRRQIQPDPEQDARDRELNAEAAKRYRAKLAQPTAEEVAEARTLHLRELKTRRQARWRAKARGTNGTGSEA